MDRRAFRKLLVEMLAQAIGAAPCGRVLLTAGPRGGRVQIGVSHDGPVVAREAVETALRASAEIAALNGGTMDVTVRAGQGVTVLARLPQLADPPATVAQSPDGRAVSGLQRAPEPTASP
jgi:hypothetical protein